MNERKHDELTPAERQAFESLPTERMPSQILEERTVRALGDRGLIRANPPQTGLVRPWMAALAIAASLALFAGGLALGQWMGARQAADVLASMYPERAERAAALVQTTGSAYAAALSRLVEATQTADPEEVKQAREVALGALWAAASEVVRLAPDDPVAAQILREFERVRGGRGAGDAEGARSVVWF